MIIKKFTAKTEDEAVAAAKKELGDNIVIMNVKNIRKKGLFSIFRRQMKEVTVALEEEELAKRSPKSGDDDLRSVVEAVSKIARSSEEESRQEKGSSPTYAKRMNAAKQYESGRETGKAVRNDIIRDEDERYTPSDEAGNRKESGASGHGYGDEANLANRRSLSERARLDSDDEHYDKRLESLHEVLSRQIGAPIYQAAVMTEDGYGYSDNEDDSNIAFFRLLYQQMLENEVDERYAGALIEDLADNVKPNMPLDHLLAVVYQRLVLKFGETETITPAAKGPKVIFFIGPTGVGKTTTIAKLASSFKVEEGKKIALLTADTYRIAAAEQLRTYANILEVPFRIIYTPAELKAAVRDYSQCDYILVDTAGHSPHNTGQKDGVADLLGVLDFATDREVYLVVSATTKYRDLLSIADSYSQMTKFSLIFTKIDETTTLGSLLNLRLYTGAPLAYITIGQNVPDDIEIFNAQETVKLLLSGGNFES